jgi:hypothetical protein
MPSPSEAEQRFLARISRRLKFIEALGHCGLAVYLPPETEQRQKAVEKLVRLTAHAGEFPHLTDERIKDATAALIAAMEDGQRLLPHDVQYLNRIRRAW